MDAAKQNHVSVGFGCLVTQAQRVADKIRNVLQLRHLIVMRENNGVSLMLELLQRFGKIDTWANSSDGGLDVEVCTRGYHRGILQFSGFLQRL